MSTTPDSFEIPCCMKSPSSEFERFSISMAGYRARNKRARLVSLLEPVISTDRRIFLSSVKESFSLKVMGLGSRAKTRKKTPNGAGGRPTLLELFVVLVPIVVTFGLQLQFSVKGLLQVDARLVGQTEDHKDHIGQFLPQVLGLIGFLFTLLPIPSGDDAGHFPHLLGELGHIGELIKIAYPVLFDPMIHGLLCVLYIHGKIVKGPFR